jgi:ABC-type transport system involved in multi-copper enzyme maturation permease subunit
MFFDPVARKELRGISRRWQTYLGRCVFVAITAYLLYEYWKGVWKGAQGVRATTLTVSQYAQIAREIFVRTEWVSLALTGVAAVIAGSDMITREARNGTLPILFLSSLTPGRVVVGKWKSVTMIALSLYLCGVPVQAIAVYLGGVGWDDLVRSAAWTMGVAAVAGAVSIYFSARLKSGGAAVAASLPLLLVTLFFFAFFDQVGDVFIRLWIKPAAPVHRGGVCTTGYAILMCALHLNLATRRVRMKVGSHQAPADIAREARALKLEDVRDRRPARSRRILSTWRAVWDANPLLWKEFTLRPALRLREDWRTRGYVLLFTFFLCSWVALGFRDGNGFFALWGAFFTLIALAGGSLLFAPEKEGRQWLMLLSTPVTALQVVRAKLLCGLIFPEAVGLIFLYGLALSAWLCTQTPFTFLAAASVCTLFLLFAYALAAAASLRSTTARGAFLFAAGVVGFLLTVPPLLAAAARPLRLLPGAGWHELWCWIEALDPLSVLDAFEIGRVRHRDIPPRAIERTLRFAALYLPATLTLPVEMVLRFRRIAIRA